MTCRPDTDLRFLAECEADDLEILVDLLCGKPGDLRVAQTFAGTAKYERYYPDRLQKCTQEIATELQTFGGNTIANTLRGGHGVPYCEILGDVCGKVGAKTTGSMSTEEKERALLFHLLEQSMQKMSQEERNALLDGLKIKGTNFAKQGVAAALQAAVIQGGFASYQVAVIVANAVAKAVLGRGLTFGANAALTRAIGVCAGPIGWIVTGLWTIVDLAGPAYRVTIPSCVHIAYMRAKFEQSQKRT